MITPSGKGAENIYELEYFFCDVDYLSFSYKNAFFKPHHFEAMKHNIEEFLFIKYARGDTIIITVFGSLEILFN